jgi:hypothetical protein
MYLEDARHGENDRVVLKFQDTPRFLYRLHIPIIKCPSFLVYAALIQRVRSKH